MHPAAQVITHIGCAALVAVVAVIAPTALGVLLLLLWAATLVIWAQRRAGKSGHGSRWRAILVQTTTMGLALVGTIYAPVKTEGRYLQAAVRLPRAEMTLTELAEVAQTRSDAFPIRVWIDTSTGGNVRVLSFSDTTMPLREFVAAVESQTMLRHRFFHCGTCSSILYGGSCSFGLNFRGGSD